MVAQDESREFKALADAALERIESALDRVADAADLDFSRVATGVIEIEFADGSKIIVNRHDAAEEMWVAARNGGFHYRWDGSAWRDTRDGSELMAALAVLISGQAGAPITI